MTHIDPKAPYDSAQHPHNWRAPVFLAPGGVVVDAPTPPVQQPPDVPVEAVSVPPAPKKTVAKKPPTRKKASDLAEALAKLSDR